MIQFDKIYNLPTFLFGIQWMQVAFCVHNMAYQGRFGFSDFSMLNLPDQFKGSFDFMDG